MVGHGGSSAGSYLADPTSPIPSHCAPTVATSTVRVNTYISHFPISQVSLVIMNHISVTILPKNTVHVKLMDSPLLCLLVSISSSNICITGILFLFLTGWCVGLARAQFFTWGGRNLPFTSRGSLPTLTLFFGRDFRGLDWQLNMQQTLF